MRVAQRTAAPVRLGRLKPQKEDTTPPDGFGAAGWKKGSDGLWETSGKPKKYAIKGDSGEWMVAHTLASRSLPTRQEIKGMLQQMDFLQGKYPLPIRPEVVIGNFTTKGVADRDTGGFTIRAKSNEARNHMFFNKGMANGEFPVGPHVIYVNTPEYQIDGARRRVMGGLSPSYKNANDGFQYIVTHEFGHLRMWQEVDYEPRWKEAMRSLLAQNLTPPSVYGRTSGYEAHAESFAEWVHSQGRTESEWTQKTAAYFGWSDPTTPAPRPR